MKKKKLIAFVVAMFMVFTCVPAMAFAETAYSGTCGTNITWTLDDDGVLIISGAGDMGNFVPVLEPYKIKEVIIGEGINNIDAEAFEDCYNLTSVTIPNGITSIGHFAFYGCSSLTSITIPDSVTTIDYYAFYGCSSLTSIAIPDSVTFIGNSAFEGCSSQTSITIPNSVTTICSYTFMDCSSLTSVTIPDSVTSIDANAFFRCSSLASIKIPEGITSIRPYTFYGCSSLTSITIPDSVTSIDYYAFTDCSSLTSIIIPDSVTSIGDSAFADCSSLIILCSKESYARRYAMNYNHTYCCRTDQNIISLPAKEPTCTSSGLTAEEKCYYCNTRKVAQMVIPAKGHEYKAVVTNPTCTEKGYTTYTCTREKCGHMYTDNEVAMLDHDYATTFTVDKKATTSAAGSKSKHCTRSGCTAKISVTAISKISSVGLSYTKKNYTGSTIAAPTVTVKDADGNVLTKGTDYDVSGLVAKTSVGRYKVTVTFKGNYEGTKELYYTIVPKAPTSASAYLTYYWGQYAGYDDVKFSWSKVTGASGYYVYYKKTTSSSYTYLTSTTNTYVRAKNFTDGVGYYFKVVPYYKSGDTKYTSLSYKTATVYTLKKLNTPTVTKSGTKVKVKWNNISGETGYQISRSTSKTGTNIVYTYATTAGTYKTVSATKGKTYYYKVRAYKTVDGKKIYGPWSSVKAYKR